MMDCEHKFVFRGLHVRGEKVPGTGMPFKKVYEVYFCERCLEKKEIFITSGHHIDIPVGASTSGYGFNR